MRSLILKGGEIYDPLTKERREGGLGIRDGRIVPVESLAGEETDVIDVGGCTVVPGFIDYHIHLYTGCDGGVAPDTISLPSGVTTAVDGGTCGVSTFEMFKRNNIDPSITRVLSYLHVSSSGLSTAVFPENADPDCFEREKITALFRKYPYILKALKIRMSRNIIEPAGLTREPLEKAIGIAEEAGCPVVVHVSDPVIPQEEIAAMLRPGDVFCHMYQGIRDTIIDSRCHVKPEIRRARERGVVFDASNGRSNFSFQVARPAVGEGFLPDIISSDISPVTFYKQPAVSLPRLMSKYLAFGLPLEQVIDMVTINPARQLGDEELGTLRDGSIADVAIVRVVEKPMQFYDLNHDFISGDRLLVPQMTIKGGEIVYCSPGFN